MVEGVVRPEPPVHAGQAEILQFPQDRRAIRAAPTSPLPVGPHRTNRSRLSAPLRSSGHRPDHDKVRTCSTCKIRLVAGRVGRSSRPTGKRSIDRMLLFRIASVSRWVSLDPPYNSIHPTIWSMPWWVSKTRPTLQLDPPYDLVNAWWVSKTRPTLRLDPPYDLVNALVGLEDSTHPTTRSTLRFGQCLGGSRSSTHPTTRSTLHFDQ